MKSLVIAAIAVASLASPAFAQKSILTGAERGAYNSTFCPPLPSVLGQSMFQGYRCVPSNGTLDNINGVLAKPSNIGFVQLDVLAREFATKPDLKTKLTVIRQDIACEGLWMVTKNTKMKTFGDVLAYARRIPFILPAQTSGSAASFAYLQSLDPDGLGRARNLRNVQSSTDVINTVAASSDNSVGFFVQFADPENANIKLMQERGLHVIPVVSREIANAKIADANLYNIESFSLKSAGFFTSGDDRVTACTPVAIITGNPDAQTDANAKDDQKDLIKTIREVPASDLLPKDDRIAKLIKGIKHVSATTVNEMIAAGDAARKAAADAINN
jgi:hypothetical protein